MTTAPTRWLDTAAAMAYVSCRSPSAFRRLRAAGKLPPPSYHFGQRSPRFDRERIDSLLAGRQAIDDAETATARIVHEILSSKGRPKNAGRRQR